MTDGMTPERLAEMRAVAEAATPGPWAWDDSLEWHADPDGIEAMRRQGLPTPAGDEFVGVKFGSQTVCVATTGPAHDRASKADAKHIATFNPPTVLALLDALQAAEAQLATLQGKLADTQEHIAYHLRDFRPGDDMKATGDLAVDMAAFAERMKARAEAAEAKHAALVERVEAVLAQHWDWKAGRSLYAAVRAALSDTEQEAKS